MSRKDRTIRKKSARQRAWTVMRIGQRFTVAEVATMSGTTIDNVTKYVLFLASTGYIQKRDGGAMVLIRDSGPTAPVTINQASLYRVYDPNTDAYYEARKGNAMTNDMWSMEEIEAFDLLRRKIEEEGLGVVAKKLGFARSTISTVKNGKYPTKPVNVLSKVGEVYGESTLQCPAVGYINKSLCRELSTAASDGAKHGHPLFPHVKTSCPECQFCHAKGKTK